VIVEVLKTANPGQPEVVEVDLRWTGRWDYSATRWSEPPRATRGGMAAGRWPFALLVGGSLYLHNAVAEALYVGGDGRSLTYGAGRSAARYERISDDVVLRLATHAGGGRTEREREKQDGTRAAFVAIVEAL